MVEEDVVVRCYKRDMYGLEASLPSYEHTAVFMFYGAILKYMNNSFT